MILSPKEVRKIAASIPNCKEIKSNGRSDILSFMLMDSLGEPARIQVYCQSGTVGTCRVLNGEVREIFERKCNLRQVLEFFSQPSKLPNVDENVFRFDKKKEDKRHQQNGNADDGTKGDDSDMVDMAALKHDEQIVDLGLSILAGEFDNLMSNFKSLLRERQREEQHMQENHQKIRGQQYQHSMSPTQAANGQMNRHMMYQGAC